MISEVFKKVVLNVSLTRGGRILIKDRRELSQNLLLENQTFYPQVTGEGGAEMLLQAMGLSGQTS